MTPRSRDIPPEIGVADPRAAYGATPCLCGATGPCANPNCHVLTGHVPGGSFVPTTERVQEALRDALTAFADTEWAREYHDLWNLARVGTPATMETSG